MSTSRPSRKSGPTCCPTLPKQETQPLIQMNAMINFLDKHLLFEYINFYLNSQYYIEENFAEFSQKMKQSLNIVG